MRSAAYLAVAVLLLLVQSNLFRVLGPLSHMLGDRFMYAVSASYLGAVAPGTGDNAGGLLVQAAVGWRFWPGR